MGTKRTRKRAEQKIRARAKAREGQGFGSVTERPINEDEWVRRLPGGIRDWGGRALSGAEISDAQERAAGRKLRAAFYPLIGDAPVLGPGDHKGATEYLNKISKAIARGGWTKSEWNRLSDLHKKWWRRANGTDPYFEVYGNRRQWADHSTTYQNAEDRKVVAQVQAIKALVWNAVQDQLSRTSKDETPAEKRARMEEIEAARPQAWIGEDVVND